MAHGVSPEVDPEEWPNARYVLVWGWNPMSTAPHLWRKLLDARDGRCSARGRRPVPQPHGAGRRRASAPAAGNRRRAWHGDDAGDRRRRPPGRGLVPRVHRGLRRAARRRWRTSRSSARPRSAGSTPGRSRESAASSRRRAGAASPGGGRTASSRRSGGLLDARLAAGPDGRLARARAAGCSYVPTATASAVSAAAPGQELRPGPVRTINMSQVGAALTDDQLDPPVKALVCWNSNPAAIAPDQEQVLAGLRREDLFTVVLEQFMTDTALHADVVLPATTQLEHLDVVFSWGHHYLTWNEPAIEPVGEAKPNTEAFRLLAARLGLDDPVFSETDEELADRLLADFEEDGLRERGWTKIDLGQGPVPHAEGGFVTETGKLALHADYVAAGRGRGRGARRALPARARHAEDAPLPQLDVREPAPPALGAATSRGRGEPRRRERPRHRGRRRGADLERPRRILLRRTRVGRRPPGVLVAPMGWWNRDYAGPPERPGHDLAAAHRDRPRADLQRQPGRDRSRSADEAVVALDGQDSARPPARAARVGCGRSAPPVSTAT